MAPDLFHETALALPGAAFDIKWGSERVYTVGGRMFAVAGHLGELEPRYMFKTSELSFALLVEQGLAHPAPYLARAGWVRLERCDVLEDQDLRRYIAQAHGLILEKLPKKLRATLAAPSA